MSEPLDCLLNYFWRPHANLADLEYALESLGVDPQMSVSEFERLWSITVGIPDDAPSATCDKCGRKQWTPSAEGTVDTLTQPDGSPCGGTFV